MLRKYGDGRAVRSNRNCHMRAHQPELTIVLGLPHLHFPRFCYGCDIPGLSFLVTLFNWMICYFPEDDLLFLHPVSGYAVFTHTCYSALTTDKHTIRQELDVSQDQVQFITEQWKKNTTKHYEDTPAQLFPITTLHSHLLQRVTQSFLSQKITAISTSTSEFRLYFTYDLVQLPSIRNTA